MTDGGNTLAYYDTENYSYEMLYSTSPWGEYDNIFYSHSYFCSVVSWTVRQCQSFLHYLNIFKQAYPSGTGLHSKGRVLALPTNISLGWKWLTLTNTLAYYATEFITAVKSFMVQGPAAVLLILTFTSLHLSFNWAQQGRAFDYARLERLASDKHSSFLSPIAN